MNIVVLVKQVPDTWEERTLTEPDKTLDRDGVDAVINELDEYAVEEALLLKEAHGGDVTVLTMGPERATESIRKALSTGPDRAVHVTDEALRGSCVMGTSKALAAALGTLEWDVVIAGTESTDARGGVLPALLAERLGVPALTRARKVTVDGGDLVIERQTDDGYQVVRGPMPAIVSVVEKINEPRYPSFKGIMAAKTKPVTTLDLADLGIDPSEVGLAGATSQVLTVTARPPRQAGQKVRDEGDGATKLAEFLASEKLI